MKIKILKKWKNKFGEESVLPIGLIMKNREKEPFRFKSGKWQYYIGGDWEKYINENVRLGEIEIL